MIDYLRTPDSCFSDLPGFPWQPSYAADLGADYRGLRLHYLDEGPRDASLTFLCLHGQPTWSYLYRHMLPVFLSAGHRVVAPDFFGFGRSDKPTDESVFTFGWHRQSLVLLIERLALGNIVLVCQDWGGLIGLTLPMDMREQFKALLVMNTMLGTGDRPLNQGFLDWRSFSNRNPDMAVGKLMQRACPHLSAAEAAAYDAPFPDASYKAGVRRFPNLVPDRPEADGAAISRRAAQFWRETGLAATFMAIGMKDPVLGPPVMAELRSQIRNCPPPLEVAAAGHFVQEWGDSVARAALKAFAAD